MNKFSINIEIDESESITLIEERYEENKDSDTIKITMDVHSEVPTPSLLNDLIRKDHAYTDIIVNLIPHYGPGYYNILPYINKNGKISILIDIYKLEDAIDILFDKKSKIYKFPFYFSTIGLEECFVVRKNSSFINRILGFRLKFNKRSEFLMSFPSIDEAMKHLMLTIIDQFGYWGLKSYSIIGLSQMFDPYQNIIQPVCAKAIQTANENVEFRFLFVPDHIAYFVNLGRGIQISDCFCGISLQKSTHEQIKVSNNPRNVKVHCEMNLEISHPYPENIKTILFRHNEVEAYSLATKMLNLYYSDWGCNFNGKLSKKYPLLVPVIVSGEPVKITNEKDSNYIKISFEYQLVVFAGSKMCIPFVKKLKKKGIPISDDLIFYRINPNDDRFRLYRSAKKIGKEKEFIKIGIIKSDDMSNAVELINSVACKYFDIGNTKPSGIILHNEKCEFLFESIRSAKNLNGYPAFNKENI